jgi:hypothetical protein
MKRRTLPQAGCQTKNPPNCRFSRVRDSQKVCNVQIWHAHFMNGVFQRTCVPQSSAFRRAHLHEAATVRLDTEVFFLDFMVVIFGCSIACPFHCVLFSFGAVHWPSRAASLGQ